jgi:hypothetical protein
MAIKLSYYKTPDWDRQKERRPKTNTQLAKSSFQVNDKSIRFGYSFFSFYGYTIFY